MQELFIPKEIVPHLLHVFNFDFKEFKLISDIKIIKIGIKNISINKLPIMLSKKLNPKMGMIIKKINE